MQNQDKSILILNRSFWPDIEATGQFLTELCEQLAKIYKVTVITGSSYYIKKGSFKLFRLYSQETFNGIEILRVWHTRFWKISLIGRLINWCTYSISAFVVALNIKPKIIIACTDPPFLGIMAMILGRLKSIPFIYNCRDLFPDVAWGLGKLDQSSFLSRSYDYLNKKAFNSARLVVCLGQSMKNKLITKGIPEERIRVIPDWVDTSTIKPVLKKDNFFLKKLVLTNKFIIMHSGNLGLSQNLSLILQALTMVKNSSSFYLLFFGEGAAKESLKEQARLLGMENVLFLPYQTKDMLSFSLSMADLHIVSLKKKMLGAVVPSKVYGIMAAGRPYLAITDRGSEAARLAEKYGCGLWVDPDDAERIAESLDWALNHPHELEEMGQRARQLAETKFDKGIIINEWLKLLDSLM